MRTRVAKPQADVMLGRLSRGGHSPYQFFDETPEHEDRELLADIAERGQLEPIDLDEDGEILSGHRRLRALDELGVEPLVTVRAGLTEAQKIEFAIKSNLLRRHPGPVEIARALRKVAERDGVTLGTKGGPAGDRRTVQRLADLFRVDRSTLYRWLDLAERLEEHPDLAEMVDAREIEARRALLIAREREARSRPAPHPEAMPSAIDLRLGDFRIVLADVADGSVDLIYTDPPYLGPDVPIYADLGAFAARVLKPTGLLLCEVGVFYLPQAIALLSDHLAYRWCISLYQPGRRPRVHAVQAISGWRPLLVFVSADHQPSAWIMDSFTVHEPPDKVWHPWQKSVQPARYYIEKLTTPGGLVVDPFIGSGSNAIAALRAGRRFVGAEIDRDAWHAARVRLAEEAAR